MSTPEVSVILPTYNRAHLLPRAIASVLGQSFSNLELIVIDDGSTDGTDQVVNAFADSRIVYLPPEQNLGDAGARNRGIAVARGEWLAFQDSDDEWLPEKLTMQMLHARTLGADFAALGCTLLRYVTDRVDCIQWPQTDTPAQSGEVAVQKFVTGFCAYLQTLLVRRDALVLLGGFDIRLKARSDFEFCLRLIQRYRIAALSEPMVLSYETLDSISLRADYRRADIRHILECHGAMLGKDRKTCGHYWYELAKAELQCGDRTAASRAAMRAIRYRPNHIFSWIMFATSPFGARVLNRLIAVSQSLRKTLHSRLFPL